MSIRKIAVIAGSLRREAYSKKTARALIALAPEGLELALIDLGDLTLFNDDLDAEGQTPESWSAFRAVVKAADGVIFVTPEYNRSITGVLKNAIDIGSRPNGQNAWSGKPAGVISTSPGRMAGVAAHLALRQTLVSVNMKTMGQPETYIGGVDKMFDESGAVIDESLTRNLTKFLTAFTAWLDQQAK